MGIAATFMMPYNLLLCKETAYMSEATVTSKGQVTIPAEIRRAMGLTAGERVIFTQLDDGTIVFRAKRRSIVELKGLLKRARRSKGPVPIKDMNIGRR
jgi:AbrB family looped-hinge helix DNA binding protein